MVEQVPSNDDGHGLGAARGGHPRDRSRSRHQPHRTLAGRKGAEYPEQGGAGGFGLALGGRRRQLRCRRCADRLSQVPIDGRDDGGGRVRGWLIAWLSTVQTLRASTVVFRVCLA
jgi:hypothetical protein